MVLVYLPTKLGDFGQGQMLVRIFQHHGLHMGYDKPLADRGYSDVHKNTHLATGHSWLKPGSKGMAIARGIPLSWSNTC